MRCQCLLKESLYFRFHIKHTTSEFRGKQEGNTLNATLLALLISVTEENV